MMIYPWQQRQWQWWQAAVQSRRIPHALLLTGLNGLGKTHFAEMMVRSFFCKQRKSNCNEVLMQNNIFETASDCRCHSCQLITGRTHPNLFRIYSEEAHAIKIDEIRAACDFIAQTAIQGDYRFVIIESANKMNHYAANALLKTLEEPAPQGIIILITDQEGALPATLRSRCCRIVFSKPTQSIAHAWLSQHETVTDIPFLLRLAEGAPLKALSLAADEQCVARKLLYDHLLLLSESKTNPIAATKTCDKIEPSILIEYFIIWIKDLMHLKLNTGEQHVVNQDFLTSLVHISSATSLNTLTKLNQYVLNLRSQIARGINLNKQLLMETLFYRFVECLKCV